MPRPKGENVGTKLKKRKVGPAEFEVVIPNVSTFKTVQIRLMGWIVPNKEANQQDYDKAMSSTKFRLKRMIRDWSESYKFYQRESIVTVDTSDVTPHSLTKPHQFFKVDVVLYVRPELKYDKYFVMETTQDIAERSVIILDEYPDFWNFTVNNNWKKRKLVNV